MCLDGVFKDSEEFNEIRAVHLGYRDDSLSPDYTESLLRLRYFRVAFPLSSYQFFPFPVEWFSSLFPPPISHILLIYQNTSYEAYFDKNLCRPENFPLALGRGNVYIFSLHSRLSQLCPASFRVILISRFSHNYKLVGK